MIGTRAHDIGRMPVRELATEIAKRGFRCIQLSLQKAITDYNFSPGRLNPGMAVKIREAFTGEHVYISVLDCNINPVHPDEKTRKGQLGWFKEHIRFARDFGCSMVATETGSLNADGSYTNENSSPKAFEILIESVSELVQTAEKFGVMICLEGSVSHTVSSPRVMKKVLDEIQSDNLQVIFDPVNLLDSDNINTQREIISEAFEMFGDRILVVHAKDLVFENGIKKTVPPGNGLLDYRFLFEYIKERRPGIDIILEKVKNESMEYSKHYLEHLLE